MAELTAEPAGGRTLFLDVGVGETRGVVQLRGRPERLLLHRSDAQPEQALGARVRARVRRVDRALNLAFLDLGTRPDAVAPLLKETPLVEGGALEVEITVEARGWSLEKGPGVRVLAASDGPAPQLLAPALSLEERLQAFAPRARIVRGPEAREAADEAQEQALATVHGMPEGGSLSIEPTRALIAVDVDVGDRRGADSKRVTRAANLLALAETARLLRLKGLAGLIVVDLAGRGHDGDALARAAREAFHADQPGVALGPISRFGAFEISKPWRERPLAERLGDAPGRLSAQTVALQAARALEREGRAASGARLTLQVEPSVAAAFEPLRGGLAERLGPRFEVVAEPRFARERFEIRTS